MFNCLVKLLFLLINSCWFDIWFLYCSNCSDNFFFSSFTFIIWFSISLFFPISSLHFWLITFFSFSIFFKFSIFFCISCKLFLSFIKFASFFCNLDISPLNFLIFSSCFVLDKERAFLSFFIFSNSFLMLLLSASFFSKSWFKFFIWLFKLFIWLIKSFCFDFWASLLLIFLIKSSFSLFIIEICFSKFWFKSSNCLYFWLSSLNWLSILDKSFIFCSVSFSLFWIESNCISFFLNWEITFCNFNISLFFSLRDWTSELCSFFNFSKFLLILNIGSSFFLDFSFKIFIWLFKLLLILINWFSFWLFWLSTPSKFSFLLVVLLLWLSFLILFICNCFFSVASGNFEFDFFGIWFKINNNPIISPFSSTSFWLLEWSSQFLCFK